MLFHIYISSTISESFVMHRTRVAFFEANLTKIIFLVRICNANHSSDNANIFATIFFIKYTNIENFDSLLILYKNTYKRINWIWCLIFSICKFDLWKLFYEIFIWCFMCFWIYNLFLWNYAVWVYLSEIEILIVSTLNCGKDVCGIIFIKCAYSLSLSCRSLFTHAI